MLHKDTITTLENYQKLNIKSNKLSTKELGPLLKSLRMRRGLTQKQLSELSGVSRTMISKIERGNREPHLSTLQSYLKCLNVDIIQILKSYIDRI